MATFPRFDPPLKQDDGTYLVKIWSAPGQFTDRLVKDLATARALISTGQQFAAMFKPAGLADFGSIEGPYWDKINRKWRVTWKEHGKKHVKTYRQREDAQERRNQLSGQVAPGASAGLGVKKISKFDCSSTSFTKLIGEAVVALNHAASAGDLEKLLPLRKYSAGLRDLSKTAEMHMDISGMEAAFSGLISHVEQVHTGRSADLRDIPEVLRNPAGTLRKIVVRPQTGTDGPESEDRSGQVAEGQGPSRPGPQQN